MSKLKFYITMDCVSFTVLILLYTILSVTVGLSEVVPEAVLVLFSMTTCIAVCLFFADKIPINNLIARMIVDLAVIIAVVFLIGGGLGFIPMEPSVVLVVLLMILVVYFATFGVLVIRNKADADSINKKIGLLKKRREKEEADIR